MKQVIQDLKKGHTYLLDVPAPNLMSESVIIKSTHTLISAGTERMLVGFGKAGLIGKAKRQPEKVKDVLNKIQSDGLLATYEAISSKLNTPIPLGYSNVGVIESSNIPSLQPGDRVVSNGHHAGYVCVGKNLCAKIPESVSDAEASFAIIGAIALQGVRLANPTLGECFAVFGLGVIGLMTAQILKANGCRVIAFDFDKDKLNLAREFGVETVDLGENSDPVMNAVAYSGAAGIDGVIITASTTSSSPISQAANMCRKRGRIIMVGVTGMTLNRADFYEKELTFQVSCSYGPGRYENNYEKSGLDYPRGFVRWTEQRNISAVLNLIAEKKLVVAPMISHRFLIDEVDKAYDVLANGHGVLGILLDFSQSQDTPQSTIPTLFQKPKLPINGILPTVAMIGAGGYAKRYLAPAMKKHANLHTVASSQGLTSSILAKSAGFFQSTTDFSQIFEGKEINTVVVASPHSTHAKYVLQALKSDKNVFVEKPLCLTLDELGEIEKAVRESRGQLTVGFNRRFSPAVLPLKKAIGNSPLPMSMVYTVNAGSIPSKHWIQDQSIGGGRIVGEACHFIDLMRFLANSPIISFQTDVLSDSKGGTVSEDISTITVKFASGSIGTIHYFANGSKKFPKERLEVFSAGRIAVLQNFRKLQFFGWSGQRDRSFFFMNKGQEECIQDFLSAIKSDKPASIPVDEVIEVSRYSILIAEDIRRKAALNANTTAN